MDTHTETAVTDLLVAWENGDSSALERLTPIVYDELHRLARVYMAKERPDHTLQATALVNEAFIRLIGWKNTQWRNRAHFYGVAAQLMRRILVDFARSRLYQKRGGGAEAVHLPDDATVVVEPTRDLVRINDALTTLARLDSRQSSVVELRFFGGLSLEEVAQVLNVSVGTVRRDWGLAKAWIYQELTARSDRDA